MSEIERNPVLVPEFSSFQSEQILPTSIGGQRLPLSEFKARYPVRYGIWESLQSHISGRQEPDRDSDKPKIDKLAKKLHLLNQLQKYAKTQETPGQILRDDQFSLFKDISGALEKGQTEMTIQATTGYGKTLVFNQVTAASDVPTLIVVPSIKVLEQTYQRFKQYSPGVEVGRMYGDRKESGKKVTITTYASLVQDETGKLIHPEGIELVILDEVHEGTTEKRIQAMEAIDRFNQAVILGFSATPSEVTEDVFAGTRVGKLSKNVVHEIGIREAVEAGYNASFTSMLVEVSVSTPVSNPETNTGDLLNVLPSGDGTSVNFDQNDILEKLKSEVRINSPANNRATLDFFQAIKKQYQEKRSKSGSLAAPFTTIGFADGIAHSQQLAKLFQEANIKAGAVWGAQGKTERDQILAQWEAGELEVVFCDKYLGVGYDFPSIKFVMCIGPTSSPTEEIQRVGRGLRLNPDDPDEPVIIADFIYPHIKSRRKQALFPQLVDAPQIFHKNISTPDGYRPRTPEGISMPVDEIEIPGLRVVMNPEEVMTVTRRVAGVDKGLEQAPPDWLSRDAFSRIIDRGVSWIDRELQDVLSDLDNHQEQLPIDQRKQYAGYFLPKNGRQDKEYFYLSPEVIEILKNRKESEPLPPPDWKHAVELAKDYKTSRSHVTYEMKKILDRLQQAQQEVPEEEREVYSKQFLHSSTSRMRDYYSPKAAEILKATLESKPSPAPDGWLTTTQMKNKFGSTHSRVSSVLTRVIPELIKKDSKLEDDSVEAEDDPIEIDAMFLDSAGKVSIHYSPAVIQEVEKALQSLPEESPEGWHTLSQVAGILHKKNKVVRLMLEQLIQDQQAIPEEERIPLSKMFVNAQKRSSIYYSPEAIQYLLQKHAK